VSGISSKGLKLSPFTPVALERILHRRQDGLARRLAIARGRADREHQEDVRALVDLHNKHTAVLKRPGL